MQTPVHRLLILAALGLVQPVLAEEPAGTWEPSTLKPETLDRVRETLESYQRCLDEETRAHLDDKLDSRRVADTILKNCESQLTTIKTAFDAEKVPDSISERYLRSKRSQAAQQVLRVVMATQATRSVNPTP
jgi:hypothetical protein